MINKKPNQSCQHCGKPMDAKSIQGLCPACLMKAGWPTSQESEPGGFEPPAIEDVAAMFPQLEILELIGRGGMGAVYKARQPDLDRLVALKVLARKAGSDPGFSERFTREAQALARLSHPCIVGVHDFGQVGDLSYFVMEYVDGPNLREIEQAGRLDPRAALEIVPQICEALQFAHDEGVVHRDIKPENILLNQKGRVKIADFGLAKLLGQDRTNFTLTEINHVMGTPHYMAPEQVEHPQDVDHRADIYSLGVVFYEMLTGELPLGKFSPPSRIVQMDVRLDEVVLKTLEKEPQRRYQQISQVQTQVETISSSQPSQSENKRIEKISHCFASTPEYQQTFMARYIGISQAKGKLHLDEHSLSFHGGNHFFTIPLNEIQGLAKGHYAKTAKPVTLNFMEITYSRRNQQQTILLTPNPVGEVLPGNTNIFVDEWLSCIQTNIEACTARALPINESQVKHKNGPRKWKQVCLFISMILIFSSTPMLSEYLWPNQPSFYLPSILFVIQLTCWFILRRWSLKKYPLAQAPMQTHWIKEIKPYLVIPIGMLVGLLIVFVGAFILAYAAKELEQETPSIQSDQSLQEQTPGFTQTKTRSLPIQHDLRQCFVDLDTGQQYSAPRELIRAFKTFKELSRQYPELLNIQSWRSNRKFRQTIETVIDEHPDISSIQHWLQKKTH